MNDGQASGSQTERIIGRMVEPQAMRLQPDHAYAYYNRGTARASIGLIDRGDRQLEGRSGQYREAIADYDQAIRHKLKERLRTCHPSPA